MRVVEWEREGESPGRARETVVWRKTYERVSETRQVKTSEMVIAVVEMVTIVRVWRARVQWKM